MQFNTECSINIQMQFTTIQMQFTTIQMQFPKEHFESYMQFSNFNSLLEGELGDLYKFRNFKGFLKAIKAFLYQGYSSDRSCNIVPIVRFWYYFPKQHETPAKAFLKG